MNDTFLPADPVKSKEQIVEALYARLEEVRRVLREGVVDPDDQFNLGFDSAKYYEAEWLTDLLDKIERS